ncbi:nucleotide sugar dehydrogenase [Alicyclobacillus fastidiosus]|uniref:Nucleotide sugar dehydrogenase n=1 Tax=Alicyclobacillus fastidiosus TaxID=392011 RepID=A0ABY6ZGZ3_9BACL|nr:nucleotide sugar dehydrogenase [Alicyclobacillus fastidiosus]WAH41767.1 nucleotide sugar dehydrogenase [Alicyclobacillus fastidiosus]GMA63460.1 UDP-N-acetyl-D-glucosamine dehydrogenase [Alicyclobacillus fastidiosus]
MAISIHDTNAIADLLRYKIRAKNATVAIVGLGYVGLPNAVAKAKEGYQVIGLDLSADKVAAILEGRSYIEDVDSELLSELVEKKRLTASNHPRCLASADVIVICVPTPINEYKQPDLRFVESACAEVARHIQEGALVVLESTTYPGTTEEILVPMLEEKGFRVGENVFVAYSPERIDPANKEYGVENTPTVVGGVTQTCGELARLYFGQNAVQVSSPKVAEMAKIYENSFRYVNIGFANEMALLCRDMDIDIWEVINAASTKPFGFMPFYPSSGVGGHCIPVDPYYLSWKVRSLNLQSRMIETAGDINCRMPQYTCRRILEVFNSMKLPVEGRRIFIVGVAYKKDVSDVRESPALDLIEGLRQLGARIQIWDNHIKKVHVNGRDYYSVTHNVEEAIREADMVVIATDHSDIDYTIIGENAKIIFDTKNVKDELGDISGTYIRL